MLKKLWPLYYKVQCLVNSTINFSIGNIYKTLTIVNKRLQACRPKRVFLPFTFSLKTPCL